VDFGITKLIIRHIYIYIYIYPPLPLTCILPGQALFHHNVTILDLGLGLWLAMFQRSNRGRGESGGAVGGAPCHPIPCKFDRSIHPSQPHNLSSRSLHQSVGPRSWGRVEGSCPARLQVGKGSSVLRELPEQDPATTVEDVGVLEQEDPEVWGVLQEIHSKKRIPDAGP
jgi:hypothetical protein